MPSTVIRRYHYSEDKEVLTITFTTNRTYKYKNVPEKIYNQFSKATSKGLYFNLKIRDKYEYKEVD